MERRDPARFAAGWLVPEEMEGLDLLVTDVVMPGMDGIELSRRVREIFPDCKVLFMSGYPDRTMPRLEDRQDMEFLPKPFSPATLAERVEALLALP